MLLVEFFASPVIRTGRFGWAHLALFYATLIVELINALVHTIDGWTAVVPTGMTCRSSAQSSPLAAAGTLFLRPSQLGRVPRGEAMKLRLTAFAACLRGARSLRKQHQKHFDKSTEYGPRPNLARAIARPSAEDVGPEGESVGATARRQTVPQGFRIEALATGLSNPRNVYPLPNGDLLMIESKKEAKEPIERPEAASHGLDRIEGARRQRWRPEQPHPAAARASRRQARGPERP